ncbi:LOW QUALITY PROTEIN: achaete-scute homolog 4 [Tachyglossus aculeatus]|uniref:LOW QUALITY PROTEIN: achaete-scute homolog 4 n=1 Tax=Tachyglossus aculeatus TaxID=9261 RepID=UPI0018F6E81D|nr:LOW QUALITY PROTEIN: achaete-scute homolog 4 [Tachyglossus aculeatus]
MSSSPLFSEDGRAISLQTARELFPLDLNIRNHKGSRCVLIFKGKSLCKGRENIGTLLLSFEIGRSEGKPGFEVWIRGPANLASWLNPSCLAIKEHCSVAWKPSPGSQSHWPAPRPINSAEKDRPHGNGPSPDVTAWITPARLNAHHWTLGIWGPALGFLTMENSKSDGLLNKTVYPGCVPTGIPMNPSQLSWSEPLSAFFQLDSAYWGPPCSGPPGRYSYLPLSRQLETYDCAFEPAFIRKRNERERQRVRCVNEGYARLRGHLPRELADKRLSKAETLRAAIGYIKHLQSLLDCQPPGMPSKSKESRAISKPLPRPECNSDGESKTSSASSPFSEAEEACS